MTPSAATTGARTKPPATSAPTEARAATRQHSAEPATLAGSLTHALALGVSPKLAALSSPYHPAEQEADRVATAITGTTAPAVAATVAGNPGLPSGGSDNRGTPVDTRQGSQLRTGTPLTSVQRAYFEPRLGHDLSQVRVHTDRAADASARSIEALAFTSGPDVAFRSDSYVPDSAAGQRLLAHELAHVAQHARGDRPAARRSSVSRRHRSRSRG